MSVIFLNQSAIHYESLGRGRPVVFLHTWIGSWRYWVPSLQAVAVSHSAYAVDLYGFGDTARRSDCYPPGHQAGLLAGFLDEMGIERIALVGHGLGALVGLLFASLHASRVARLLAVAMPLETDAMDGKLVSSGPAELLELLAGHLPNPSEILPNASAIDPAAIQALPETSLIHGALSALQDSGIPLLLVYGADDPLLRPPAPDHAFTLGQHVHQIVLPDSGHFPMLDSADTFNRLMLDFLGLESGASPRGLQPREEWHRRVR